MSAKRITEYISAIVIIVILSILSMFPLLLLSYLCSAALIATLGYLTTKYHYGLVFTAALFVLFPYVLFTGNVAVSIAGALPMILCGVTLGICYNLKLSSLKTIGIFTGVYAVNMTANIKLSGAMIEQDIFESAMETVHQIFRETLSSTQLPESELNEIVSTLISTILQFTPAFMIMMCFVFAILCFYVFKGICTMRKCDVSFYVPFSQWKAEKSISILFIVFLVLSFMMPAGHILTDAILNVVLVMTFVFFVFGLALIEHILENKIQKIWKRKCLFVLIILFTSFIAGLPFLVLSVAGTLDGMIDYRQKKIFRH